MCEYNQQFVYNEILIVPMPGTNVCIFIECLHHNINQYLYDFDILHVQIIWLIWFIAISSYLYLIVRILRANI